MIPVLGTVQRLVWYDGVPATEWRTRNAALFADEEWGWSRDGDAAFVFPMYDRPAVSGPDDYARSAAVHVAELKKSGEKNWVCASTYGVLSQQARAQRSAKSEASALGSVEDLQREESGAAAAAARVDLRAGDKIQERIHNARGRGNGRGARKGLASDRLSVDPAEVFAREERRHLA